MCDWMDAMNHFEYLRELSDDIISDDDKQRAYKGKGGIDEHCHPFKLYELWESLVKRLASSNKEGSQASLVILPKESTIKEISQESLIASTTKNDVSTVQQCAWH